METVRGRSRSWFHVKEDRGQSLYVPIAKPEKKKVPHGDDDPEIPDALKTMFEPLRDLVVTTTEQIERCKALSREPKYEVSEGEVAAKLAAVERGAHEAALSALDVDAAHIQINGELHVNIVRSATTFHSQAGDVPITRTLYRRVGDRNGPTVDPVALRAGAVDGEWLPGAARDMAHLLSHGTSREAEAIAREMGRLPYSRSSFERVGHAVGETFVEQHQHVEQLLIEAYEIPRGVQSVSASLDRVSVPMEEPLPRPVGRPRKGAAKKPIEVVYRMAYCGTVTIHDAEGAAIPTPFVTACDARWRCPRRSAKAWRATCSRS